MKGLLRICGMRGWKKEVGDGTRPTPTNYASQKTVLSNLCCVYIFVNLSKAIPRG